jgi:hypothetical protein
MRRTESSPEGRFLSCFEAKSKGHEEFQIAHFGLRIYEQSAKGQGQRMECGLRMACHVSGSFRGHRLTDVPFEVFKHFRMHAFDFR